MIKNEYGTVISNAAKLTVRLEPVITTQPKDVKAAYGDAARFTIKVSGSNLTYQWQYQSPNTDTWRNSTLSGAKTATVTVTAEKARNGQKYRCIVKNQYGSVTSDEAWLIAALVMKPSITTNPHSVVAGIGDTVCFSIQATGGNKE